MAETIYAPDPWAALSAQHSDIRREQTVGFGDTKYAIAVGNDVLNREILNSSHQTDTKVDEATDKIQQRAADYYIASQARDFDNSRDLAALRAQVDLSNQKLSTEILLSSERAAAAAALAGEKTAAAAALESARLGTAVALGQSQTSKEILETKYELSRQISDEAGATRDLINSLKTDELNRMLIERNTDVNHFRHGYWDAVGGANNAQFASVASQLNAFQSQLQETRQGMVNFGTMAGVGQSSTNNNVR